MTTMDGTMTHAFSKPLFAILAATALAFISPTASARTHHHHVHAVAARQGPKAPHGRAGRRHHRHHLVPQESARSVHRGHHHAAPPPVIHRHAQLCQQVMVHNHWVSHCR
jgi:hypothetical protein